MEYFKRLGQFWFPNGLNSLWWLLFAIAPLYFFETTVHEFMHSFASALAGDGFKMFAPFPHYNTEFGSRVNGWTDADTGFVIMPQVVAAILIAVFTAIAVSVPVRSYVARFFIRMLYLGFTVDLAYNLANRGGDWGYFADNTGVEYTNALGMLFWPLMLSHIVWVYFSKWHDVDDQKTSDDPVGFWDYRLICLVLTITSAIAIVVFLGVSHPAVVKRHWLFVTVLILHFAMVAWGIVYLIIANRQKKTITATGEQ